MVYIFLADGFEDMEAVQPRDLLLRAGIKVKTVGIGAKTVKSAFGLAVTADITEDEFDPSDADAVVFPGGMPGAANLAASKTVKNAVGIALPLQQGGIHLYGELPGGKAVGNALNAAQVERQVMP